MFRQKRWLKDSESQLTVSGIESIIENLMKHAGIKRIKQNEKRYDLPVCNGFRNRFNTILKRNSDISYPIAEKFLDHKLRMEPSYLFPTKQELFDEYKKAVPELMVSEEARLKLESENKQKHIEKLETEKDIQMKDMQEQIDSVKELLRRKDS